MGVCHDYKYDDDRDHDDDHEYDLYMDNIQLLPLVDDLDLPVVGHLSIRCSFERVFQGNLATTAILIFPISVIA